MIRRLSVRFGFVLLLLAFESCTPCKRESRPCFAPAADGPFEVELVQHFGMGEPRVPLERGSFDIPGCEDEQDLAVGSRVAFRRTTTASWFEDDQCNSDCYYLNGTLVESEFTSGASERAPRPALGVPEFVARGTRKVHDCEFDYEVGIASWDLYTLNYALTDLATDYVLTRMRSPIDYECAQAAGLVTETCRDQWAVRIRDSSGRVVSRDLPPRPNQVDASPDDAAQDDDAGH